MSHKRPLKATDKRRNIKKVDASGPLSDSNGAGPALGDIFNNRKRRPNGHGKRAV